MRLSTNSAIYGIEPMVANSGGWSGPDAIKVCFAEQLDARHAKARELLVQRPANLHQQITVASMFQRLRGSQH